MTIRLICAIVSKMEEKVIEIESFTTTTIKCPCGGTIFQIPNVTNGEKSVCGFCGREFEVVIKVRISRPNKKRSHHIPRII